LAIAQVSYKILKEKPNA